MTRRQASSWSFPVTYPKPPRTTRRALTPILPGKLWQSGTPDSPLGPAWQDVEACGIDLVVSLADAPADLRFEWASWAIDDGDLPDMVYAHQLAHFVAERLEAGRKVLICCKAGINRSSLLSALVVAEVLGCSRHDAADHIRRLRPGALSNQAFAAWLDRS